MDTITSKKTIMFVILLVVLAVIVGFARYYPPASSSSVDETSTAADDTAVKDTITAFGGRMQMVSLLAPAADVKAAMDANYGAYVTPELLALWENDPANAPGRLTSSPWPDRIEITGGTRAADGTYRVTGTVIEVTSMELENGGASGQYPVVLILENRGGTWLISSYQKL